MKKQESRSDGGNYLKMEASAETMQIKIPEETSKRIKEVAAALGIKSNDLIEDAIVLYVRDMHAYLKFQEEVRGWEKIRTEAFLQVEKLK